MEILNRKQSLINIGYAIKNHRSREVYNYSQNCAVARVSCNVANKIHPNQNGEKIYWLINDENTSRAYKGDGFPVYKNTPMGSVLSTYHSGIRNFDTRTTYALRNAVTVNIHNRATYSLTNQSAKEITVNFDSETKSYHFQRLSDLINKKKELEKKLADMRLKQEKERKEREEAARKAEKHLETEEAERKRREEKARRRKEQEELAEMERKVAEASEAVEKTQSFIRQGDEMRSQHILDEFQENAKRSHLYDGVPIVIEGGPGTGKTTTMIQRLKFLISAQALDGYNAPLSKQQISTLTDPATRDNNWLFFSPTTQLLSFLRQNMVDEGLKVNSQNSTELISDNMCGNIWVQNKRGRLSIYDVCYSTDGINPIAFGHLAESSSKKTLTYRDLKTGESFTLNLKTGKRK